MSVKESSSYDNYMDNDSKKSDVYSVSLDRFFDEPLPDVLYDNSNVKKVDSDVWKSIYVSFRNLDDVVDFCTKINQMLPIKGKEFFHPLHDTKRSLFEEDSTPVVIDRDKLAQKEVKKTVDVESQIVDKYWKSQWKGMPEYSQKKNHPYRNIVMKFRSEEDYNDFSQKIGQALTSKTKNVWHPKLVITKNRQLRWIQETRTDPNHPMYIVSKGRADSMITSRSFARMLLPHYIVIEPQDEAAYEEALDTFDIRSYATLLVAPFSNHGDGPGRARNWAWDHSMSIGATSHWVFDDNISDFYRLHENERIRFETGVGFRVMEDFVDRYDNIYIAGPAYRFFIAPNDVKPAFIANTRIYSSLLIRNDCKHRWRGRYNEDTDICLRVMKDGDACVQFNAFLQGKCATQSVSGGNTAEFYHAENADNEEFKETGYNTEGTVNKSQMLVDMHPDVARLFWKYGRWHHHVDYTVFKHNTFNLRPGIVLPDESNNYGMVLDRNFDWKKF